MSTSSTALTLSALFAALADPIRLRLLNLMSGREVCVCYFVEILGQSQPKISRHLAYLKRAGIVDARREGKWMHYRIRDLDTETAPVLAATLDRLKADPAMRADLARLDRACCEPHQFTTLQGAPRPSITYPE